MLRAPEPVLLVIADISGYTASLAGTEIDHAENVLQDLLKTVEGQRARLRLIAVEGDALFTLAPGAPSAARSCSTSSMRATSPSGGGCATSPRPRPASATPAP